MGIDYLFYPEKAAAQEVINLLGHTSTTEYVDFREESSRWSYSRSMRRRHWSISR